MSKYNYPGYKPTSDGFLTARPKSRGGYHGGTDNAAAPGTPVYAQYGGKVFRSGPINGYGMAVIVKSEAPDGTRFYQLYGHLGPGPLPPPGTPVTADQPIPGAVIGTTEYVRSIAQGITQGPHVHREIISENATLNESDRLGTDSSDLTYKADPDTFDINHPVFPYEPPHGAPLPPRQPQQGNGETRLTAPPPAHSDPAEASSPELSPGMAIPGAEDPTVVGGPDAQYPLVLVLARALHRREIRGLILPGLISLGHPQATAPHRATCAPLCYRCLLRDFQFRDCWPQTAVAFWIDGPRLRRAAASLRKVKTYPAAFSG
jgi:hypothetical protein